MEDSDYAEDIRAKVRELNTVLASAAMAGLKIEFEIFEVKTIQPGRHTVELNPRIMRYI